MRRHGDVSNRSAVLTHQFDVMIISQHGLGHSISLYSTLAYYAVHFLGVSGGSLSIRYQLVRCYNVSKTSVSFQYQLWCLCNVLSWSVLLRYQLVRRCDFWNWSVLLTYQWDITETSQIGSPYWRTSLESWWFLSMVRNVRISLYSTLAYYAVHFFGVSRTVSMT